MTASPFLPEPEATAWALVVLGLLLLVSALFSRASARFGVPVFLVFLAFGMLAGSEGIDGIAFEDYGLAFRLGAVAAKETTVLQPGDTSICSAGARIGRSSSSCSAAPRMSEAPEDPWPRPCTRKKPGGRIVLLPMRMRILPVTLASLLFAGSSFVAFAARAPRVPDPLAPGLTGPQRLDALVERVKYEQRQLKTLEARFTQQQESSLLAAPEESRGVFSYAAPDRVRWEYLSPNPITVVIRGDEMTTWYRDLKRAEVLTVGRYSNQVFKYLGASGSLQTLLQYFTVKLKLPEKKGEPYRLELLPRYQRIAKRLKSMTLWIDDVVFFPSRLKYVEADGDSVEYQFRDLKRNAPIPPDRFVLKLPPGVETRVVEVGGAKSKP